MPVANGFNRLGEVYFALCKAVDSPVSLGLWLRFKHGEHRQLAEFSLRPEWYCSAWSFHLDYVCSEFLSKNIGLDTGIDKEAVALRGFATYEESCRITNSRILEGRYRGCSPRVESVLYAARRKISNLLKDYDIGLWLDRCKWGPGATYSLKGDRATLDDKIREDRMSITAAALPYFRKLISDDYAWLSSRGIEAEGPCCLLLRDFEVVPGCRVTTVPKNAKTDRTIAIEPTLNQFLQGGVGNYIRSQLRHYGIDLNDQTRNQYGAETALKRRLATVDLKAASDTVSRELVYELLPVDWAMLLDDLRSKKYQMPDGTWHDFEKFSTMGNGFTFELESLIFWALSESVKDFSNLKEHVLVYGDDIIIDERALPLLLEVFEYCGFTVNSDKTHFNSQFRESCGKHYFSGFDVTPIYQKEVPDVLEELYRMANRIRRLAFRMAPDFGCMGVLKHAWLAAIRGIRISHVTILDSQDDDGVALPYDEIQAIGLVFDRRNTNGGNTAVKLPVLSFRPRQRKLQDCRSLLAYWLRFTPTEPFDGRVAVRRRGKYVSRRRWTLVGCRSAPWI